MFGGHRLDVDGLMVGLIADEQLYLETDAQWQTASAAANKRPRSHAPSGSRLLEQFEAGGRPALGQHGRTRRQTQALPW